MIRRKNSRKVKVPKYLYIVSLGLLLFLSVGYSMINSTLGIEGNVVASKNNWDIHFDNIVYADDSVEPVEDAEVSNETELKYNVKLENPGDKYAFTFDIVNAGSLDGIIKELDFTNLTDEQKKYIDYKITYIDGTKIEVNDILRREEIKKAKVELIYKDKRSNDDYPEENIELPLKIYINYTQAKEENYKLTINNTTTNTYSTSNIKEELELPEVITEENKAIVCNNKAIPTVIEGKLKITNIKGEVTCTITNSLKEAVELTENENSYITILNNEELNNDNIINIPTDKKLTINLNDKIVSLSTAENNALITNNGTLTIIGNEESLLSSNKTVIRNEGTLKVISTSIEKVNSTNKDESAINGGGRITLENVNITSDANTLVVDKESTKVNITSSTLKSNENATSNVKNKANNSVINIYSSIITSAAKALVNEADGNIYLCNTKVEAKEFDIASNNKKVFYSKDSLFTNGTNNPNSENNKSVRSDIACKKY